jgi:hypothetical protein
MEYRSLSTSRKLNEGDTRQQKRRKGEGKKGKHRYSEGIIF